MKNTLNIKSLHAIALFGLMCIFTACDVLDTEPFTSYDEATVWGSKATADAFVNGTVSAVMDNFINGNQTAWEERTNNTVHVNGLQSGICNETIDRYADVGFNQFGNIRRCNLIIEKAGEYSGKGLSESESKELVAKGKLLRGILYYKQARMMGRVVWIDHVLAPADTAADGLKLPLTASTTESYEHIIADLQAAIPNLPESAQPGELDRNTGNAFLSEIALQGAAYADNDAKRKEWLQLAVTAANAVTGCTLADNYGAIFNENAPTSDELIFCVYRSKVNTTCPNIVPMQNTQPNINNDALDQNSCDPAYHFKTNGGQPFIGWLWWSPTQNLADCYDVVDDATGQAVAWNESSQFKDAVNRADYTTSPPAAVEDFIREDEVNNVIWTATAKSDIDLSALIYRNRDQRFYDTYVYDGCTYWNEFIRTSVKGNLWRYSGGSLRAHIGLTSNYIRKGLYTNLPRIYAETNTDYHFVVTRYGRVLLNKAEALLWLARDGGSYAEAVNILNDLRTTHGKLPASTVSSLADAWKLYMKERRIELFMENDYYWSLLRWGKHGGDANYGQPAGGKIIEFTTKPTYIEIARDLKSLYVGTITHVNTSQREFREDRRYLFPIPQGQIERNDKLTQNPGW